MVDHAWLSCGRLCGVPVRFSAIQLGGQLSLESLFADSEFELTLSLPLTEAA